MIDYSIIKNKKIKKRKFFVIFILYLNISFFYGYFKQKENELIFNIPKNIFLIKNE